MTDAYLVLIETFGNQNYIFSSNKLKENIGASELTYRAGTQWILEAIASYIDNREFEIWKDAERLRALLRDEAKNPPLENSSQTQVEVLTASSGKALLLAKAEAVAQAIIKSVTRKALEVAPGLTIAGVYEKVEDWQTNGSLAASVKRVYHNFENVRSRIPAPESRFLRLPIIAECASSGLPASDLIPEGNRKRPISRVNEVKQDFSKKAKDRLKNLDNRLERQIDRLLQEEETAEPKSWLAIVHADGNGLGQIFLKFEQWLGADQSNRHYIETYRQFSLALDECTEAAFRQALAVFPPEKTQVPVVPLIVGGDDLTVVCDGHYALEFTREFLQAFEQQTRQHPDIRNVAQAAFGVDYLSACAGIAIVKRHFPFSVAYGLAEELIQSAKAVKRQVRCKVTDTMPENTPFPCSAIDFHILHDTSGIDLDDIRDKLTPQTNTLLFNRPYVVTDVATLQASDGYEWATLHHWNRLSDRIQQLNSDETVSADLLPLSSSQYHAIRTALFAGKQAADAQYALVKQRYDLSKFTDPEAPQSFFYSTLESEGETDEREVYKTSFLDALEAMEFLKNAQHEISDPAWSAAGGVDR